MQTAVTVQIIAGLLIYFSMRSEAGCTSLSRIGYVVDDSINSISCRDFGGAWVLECCIRCSVNIMASGAILVDNEIFTRMDEALSFNYSNPPKVLQLLPGAYHRPGNCESTINYDSIQLIGVCGNAFTKLDCDQSAFHFKLTGRNITIQGLTLMNGKNVENGGCISITPPATGITLVDTFLVNCISYSNGGAISLGSTDLMQQSQSLSISMIGGCRIENCSAKNNGGALYVVAASRYPSNTRSKQLTFP
jgi:hypothetical protein